MKSPINWSGTTPGTPDMRSHTTALTTQRHPVRRIQWFIYTSIHSPSTSNMSSHLRGSENSHSMSLRSSQAVLWFKINILIREALVSSNRTHSFSLSKKENLGADPQRSPGTQGSMFTLASWGAETPNSVAEPEVCALPPRPLGSVCPVSPLLFLISSLYFRSHRMGISRSSQLSFPRPTISLGSLSPSSSSRWKGIWLTQAEPSVCPCPMSRGQGGGAGDPLPSQHGPRLASRRLMAKAGQQTTVPVVLVVTQSHLEGLIPMENLVQSLEQNKL